MLHLKEVPRLALGNTGSTFTEAWRLTGTFWLQSLAAFARHPGLVLLYAVPAAAARAWVLLRTRPVPAWWIPCLDALLILWRLLMCAVALWIVLTPPQIATLRATLTSNSLLQSKLDGLGVTVGRQLRLLSWEIALYVVAFLLLNWLLTLIARLCIGARKIAPERKKNQRVALAAILRNLLLVPLALIYVAVVIRDIVSRSPHLK
jgi:hypothetical protein